MKINAAAVQCGPVENNPEETITRAVDWIEKAAERDVKLIVFPELYYPGFQPLLEIKTHPERHDELFAVFDKLAESVPGPAVETIGKAAKKHEMHVVFALMEKSGPDTYHNSSVLIGSSGDVLNVHRKTILTPSVETPEFTPGDTLNVTKTEIGNIGQLICADSSCPESARILAIKGADIICHSMGGFRIMVNGRDMMDVTMENSHASKSRAMDNSVFWIMANQSCCASGYEFFGKSRILNFIGDNLAMGSEGTSNEELVIAEIDLQAQSEIMLRLIDRRRPEIYKEILLPNEELKKISGEFMVKK